jgi:hypothetical protein
LCGCDKSRCPLFISNTILLFLRGPQRLHSALPTTIPDQPRVDRIGTRATKAAGLALPLALLLLFAARLGWVSGAWVLPAEHLATLGWLMLMIVGVAYAVYWAPAAPTAPDHGAVVAGD